jgi:chemotaxis regulatin CheY-phosphate phosphatase CheZ
MMGSVKRELQECLNEAHAHSASLADSVQQRAESLETYVQNCTQSAERTVNEVEQTIESLGTAIGSTGQSVATVATTANDLSASTSIGVREAARAVNNIRELIEEVQHAWSS